MGRLHGRIAAVVNGSVDLHGTPLSENLTPAGEGTRRHPDMVLRDRRKHG